MLLHSLINFPLSILFLLICLEFICGIWFSQHSIPHMMNDSDQIVSLAQVAKDPAKGGNNFLDESTRDFEVTSEEEREDLESPNTCNRVNEYSCRLCEEVRATYLSLSRRALFGTRPPVLLVSVSHI